MSDLSEYARNFPCIKLDDLHEFSMHHTSLASLQYIITYYTDDCMSLYTGRFNRIIPEWISLNLPNWVHHDKIWKSCSYHRDYLSGSRCNSIIISDSSGENYVLTANQSVDCHATTLFTISLNSAEVWNRGFNWPVFGVEMHKQSPNEVSFALTSLEGWKNVFYYYTWECIRRHEVSFWFCEKSLNSVKVICLTYNIVLGSKLKFS